VSHWHPAGPSIFTCLFVLSASIQATLAKGNLKTNKKNPASQVPVAHAYNVSYLGD
jgi:hypothetical protein